MLVAVVVALVRYSGPEIAICDTERKVSWSVDGKRHARYALRAWTVGSFAQGLEEYPTRPGMRLVMLRIPWVRDSPPNVFAQYPDGTRGATGNITLATSPKKAWVAFLMLPRSGGSDRRGFEVGVANGPWRTTGTYWPLSKRRRGERFVVDVDRFVPQDPGRRVKAKLPSGEPLQFDIPRVVWTLSTGLPRAPREEAWRVVPYGRDGNAMRSVGSKRSPGASWLYSFLPARADDVVTRVDLQRRSIEWTGLRASALESKG